MGIRRHYDRLRSDRQVRTRVGDHVIGVGQSALVDGVGADIGELACRGLQAARERIVVDEARRRISQGWVEITIGFALGIGCHRDRLRCDRQIGARIGDRVVRIGERTLIDGIGADARELARGGRERAGKRVVVNQARSRIGQRRIEIAINLALRIGRHRDRLRRDRQIGTSISNRIIGVRQASLVDGVGANTRELAGARRKRTGERVVIDQARGDIGQGRIGVTINLALRIRRHRDRLRRDRQIGTRISDRIVRVHQASLVDGVGADTRELTG